MHVGGGKCVVSSSAATNDMHSTLLELDHRHNVMPYCTTSLHTYTCILPSYVGENAPRQETARIFLEKETDVGAVVGRRHCGRRRQSGRGQAGCVGSRQAEQPHEDVGEHVGHTHSFGILEGGWC